MQASCAARATRRIARTRPLRSRTARVPPPSEGVTTWSQPDVTFTSRPGHAPRAGARRRAGAGGPCRRLPLATNALPASEGDVLRRGARRRAAGAGFAAAVEGDPASEPEVTQTVRPSGAKTTSWAERRRDRPHEARSPRVAQVEHGDARRSVPERRPERAAVRADRRCAVPAPGHACARSPARSRRRARRSPRSQSR